MDVQTLGKKVLSKVAQNYVLDKAGVYDRLFNGTDNTIIRSVKQGGIWYLANETNDLLMGEPSNLTAMNLDKLVDDVAYFSLSSAIVTNMNLSQTVENLNPLNNMFGADVNNAIVSGVLQTGVELVGDTVISNAPNENVQKIRHFSKLWK